MANDNERKRRAALRRSLSEAAGTGPNILGIERNSEEDNGLTLGMSKEDYLRRQQEARRQFDEHMAEQPIPEEVSAEQEARRRALESIARQGYEGPGISPEEAGVLSQEDVDRFEDLMRKYRPTGL